MLQTPRAPRLRDLLTLCVVAIAPVAAGQAGAGDGPQPSLGSRSADDVWHFADEPDVTAGIGTRGLPNAYMIVRLDRDALQASLARISKRRHNAPLPVLTLPMPGRLVRSFQDRGRAPAGPRGCPGLPRARPRHGGRPDRMDGEGPARNRDDAAGFGLRRSGARCCG